jgi:hypothetical protein
MIAREISAAAIEWGAKAEKRRRPNVAVPWPRRDHRLSMVGCTKLVPGFAGMVNRVMSLDGAGSSRIVRLKELAKCSSRLLLYQP